MPSGPRGQGGRIMNRSGTPGQPITTGFGGAGSRIMGYNDRSPNPQERNIGYDRMGGPDRTLPGGIMHMLENPNNYRSMDERIGLENLQEDNIWNRLRYWFFR